MTKVKTKKLNKVTTTSHERVERKPNFFSGIIEHINKGELTSVDVKTGQQNGVLTTGLLEK